MEPDYVNNDGRNMRHEDLMSEKLLGPNSDNDEAAFDMEVQQQPNNHHHHHSMIDDSAALMIHDRANDDNGAASAGEKQPNQYRDVWAAVLFLAAHVVVLYLAFVWGIPALNTSATEHHGGVTPNNNNDDTTISFTGIILLVICSSLAALVISGLALAVLMRAAHQLIQISLLSTVVLNILLTVVFMSMGLWIHALVALVFAALAGFYAWSVWRRIPFAAANLQVALTAIEANGGLVLTALGVTVAVNVVFSLIWLLASLGVYMRNADCSDGTTCVSHTNPAVGAALLLFYYWTAEVGKNILCVTTAGVVGTFWFAPHDACTFCSPAVTDSLVRAGTYSLGSICLGSLLTACLNVLHHWANSARRHGRGHSIVLCILECLAGFLERLVTYFNKWAYVYVGLYGYDYLTAGKKVMTLFVHRGWSVIINDDLVVRVLTLVSVVIGALTGCVGLLLARANPGWVDEFGDAATIVAFFIPALIGMAMAHVLISVVVSAVDTVVVAFAEAPMEFERNHPGLSTQLVAAWREVYPQEFGI